MRFADRLERELAGCEDPLEGLRGVVRIHAEEFGRSLPSTRTGAHELADGLPRASAEVPTILLRIVGVTKRFVDMAAGSGASPPLDLLSVHYLLTGPLIFNAMVVPTAPPSGDAHSDWKPRVADLTAMHDLIARIVVPAVAGRSPLAADLRRSPGDRPSVA